MKLKRYLSYFFMLAGICGYAQAPAATVRVGEQTVSVPSFLVVVPNTDGETILYDAPDLAGEGVSLSEKASKNCLSFAAPTLSGEEKGFVRVTLVPFGASELETKPGVSSSAEKSAGTEWLRLADGEFTILSMKPGEEK